MAKHGLTKLDQLFVDEYFANGFNGSLAYSTIFTQKKLTPKVAKSSAWKLMAKPEIKLEIQKRWDDLKDVNIVRHQELLMELKETYFVAIQQQDYPLLLKTIDMINKMCGHYTTIIDATFNGNINITIPGLSEDDKNDDDEE